MDPDPFVKRIRTRLIILHTDPGYIELLLEAELKSVSNYIYILYKTNMGLTFISTFLFFEIHYIKKIYIY